MKQIYISILFLLVGFCLNAQCPPVSSNGIYSFNQNDIDSFMIKYPNCQDFEGSMFEQGDIENLRGFSNIRSISGVLYIGSRRLKSLEGLENLNFVGKNLGIGNNPNLESLEGLGSLTAVGGRFYLGPNDKLQNLRGIENLTSIGEFFWIRDNPSLVNLEGLNSLTSIEEDLWIENNDALKNLKGLESLNIVGNVKIEENDSLVNLEGLEGLTNVGVDIELENNLSLENLQGLEGLTVVGKDLWIRSNSAIKNLKGIEKLSTVGTLYLHHNPLLESLEGSENLATIELLTIFANHTLENLKGLENLTSIKKVFISTNRELRSIESLKNITSLEGLSIRHGDSLKNLKGLHNLTSVTEDLEISSTPLENIESLSNLISVGGKLEINGTKSIEGLENLATVGGALSIRGIDAMKNSEALKSLTTVGEILVIEYNHILENLDGFRNLTSIGSVLRINNNDALESITGFRRLTSIGGNVHLYNNPNLSTCSIEPVCNFLLQNTNTGNIHTNATGCDSTNEIVDLCEEIGRFNYTIFFDQNQNGIQDSNELIVPNIPIKIEETDETLINGSTNAESWVLEYGNYTASFIDNPDWELTTLTEQNFEISDSTPVVDISFGIFPKNIFSEKITFIQSSWLRCGTNVPFDIIAKNLGTTLESGTLWFEIDLRLTDFTSNADIVNGNTLGWYFQDLHPGHGITERVNIQIPVPPEIPVGEILKFKSFFDTNENQYNGEVRCAYDPNDKLVTPDRSGEYQGTAYTKFEEDLFYTVRFQNTGNDVAYDVVIRDTLDANLDPSTFKIISSSHFESLNVAIEDDRNIAFEFKDIFLPDSTTNFDASNGYVSYLIKTKDGLPEETLIQNTASIYFDFNPSVVTNTTENLMVTELPTSSTADKYASLDVHVFPNPTDGKVYLSGVDLSAARISVYDLTGRLILIEKSGANEIILPKAVSGMLFLKIETEEGIAVKRVFKN